MILILINLFLHFFEGFLHDAADGDGEVADVEDEATAVVDAVDVTLQALEDATGDADVRSLTLETVGSVVDIFNTIGLKGHEAHERLHLTVGNGNGLVGDSAVC